MKHFPSPTINSDWIQLDSDFWTCEKVWEIITNKDYYTEHTPRQPKKVIADYVASEGFKVPKRFETFFDVLKEWKRVIFRSEHPQEYGNNEFSGKFESWEVNLEEDIVFPTEAESLLLEDFDYFEKTPLHNKLIEKPWEYLAYFVHSLKRKPSLWSKANEIFAFLQDCMNADFVEKNCDLLISPERKELTYSFWEYIPWINHSIIADADITGRFYIFSTQPEQKEVIPNSKSYTPTKLTIVQDWEVIQEHYSHDNFFVDWESLSENYDAILSLPNFNGEIPTVQEWQTGSDRSHYFLQIHRFTDYHFRVANFCLTPEQLQGGIKVRIVRWATTPWWEVFHVDKDGNSLNYELKWENSYIKSKNRFKEWYKDFINSIATHHEKVKYLFSERIVIDGVDIYKLFWEESEVSFLFKVRSMEYVLCRRVLFTLILVSDGKNAVVKSSVSPEEFKALYQEAVWVIWDYDTESSLRRKIERNGDSSILSPEDFYYNHPSIDSRIPKNAPPYNI